MRQATYSGAITAEQFLFHEMRITARFYMDGASIEAAVHAVKQNNLFQYPTERMVPRMVRTCYKRLEALGNESLRRELLEAPQEDARQISLYAMMRYNRLVWEFMTGVIGEKYRSRDFTFSRKDLNIFFSRLQGQNDEIAGWSETTIIKIKQVLAKCLVGAGMLDTAKAEYLIPILICKELEAGIWENGDYEALAAFNCF